MKFQGFVRENGQVGIRNHVVVMPGVICAEMAAKKIASECGAVFLANPIGCGLNPKDMTVMLDAERGKCSTTDRSRSVRSDPGTGMRRLRSNLRLLF